MYRRPAVVLGILLALVPALPAAESDWPVARGPSHEPRPYRYDAKVLDAAPRAFLEDYEACILYSGTTHRVEADGTAESTSHEITRLNSRKGIEKLGEYRNISFDPNYEKLTLNEARVIKANGTIVPIEARHVQLRDTATDFQVYDPDKQLVISFPNLEVGDVYEVRWTVRGKNPEFGDYFFTRYTFGDDQFPVLRDELRVRVPKDRTLRHATINGKLEPTIAVLDDKQREYFWQIQNKPGLPRDDDHPSKEELRLQVACSTFPTWEAVGRWKHKLRAECWKCTEDIRKTVAEVTHDMKSPADKARALTHWVRSHIRYMSRGPGGMGYTPHLPEQVLHNLYGDCKDQAQLLAVMLKEIGLPVWLVTLGTLDDGQVLAEVPSPWGTHAILLVQIEGKDYWIDTTLTDAAWDFLPRSDRGRMAYLTRDGELKLLRTPEFTCRDHRTEQKTQVSVGPDGTSHCKREATYDGSSAWARRESWLDAPPGERRRLLTAELQDANSKSKLRSLAVDEKNLHDFDQPVRVHMEFDIPRHFGGDAREGSITDSPVWSRFLAYNLDPDRQLAMVLPTPFESRHHFTVELPLAFRFDGQPEDRDVKGKWGSFQVRVSAATGTPRRLEVDTHMKLEQVRIEKVDFADFQRFHDDVSKAYRVWINLKPTRDIADAPELEKFLDKQPRGESSSAKVLARLYIDHDRKEDARRVLDKATQLDPDDKALWELRIQAADGLAAQEQLYRDMVKRFPQETKYSLALAGVCIKRAEYPSAQKILVPLTGNESGIVGGAAQYQLAQIALHQDQPKAALRHLEAVEVSDPAALANAEGQHFRARVYEKLGQPKEAIEALRRGLEFDAQAHDLLLALVELERRAGMQMEALDHLRRFTVACAGDAVQLTKAAELHYAMERYEDARELATRAFAKTQSQAARRILGLVAFHDRDYRSARTHLQQADRDIESVRDHIQACLHLGDLSGARAASEEARTLEGDAALRKLREDLRSLQERFDKLVPPLDDQKGKDSAVQSLVCAEYGVRQGWPISETETLVQEATAKLPDLGPALALRGWLRVERGQLRLALADAEKALEQQPAEARAYAVRGRVRFERGAAGALDDLKKAAEMTSNKDGTILHWLAAAQLDAGTAADALRTQQQAAQLCPRDSAIQEQLRQIEKRARDKS